MTNTDYPFKYEGVCFDSIIAASDYFHKNIERCDKQFPDIFGKIYDIALTRINQHVKLEILLDNIRNVPHLVEPYQSGHIWGNDIGETNVRENLFGQIMMDMRIFKCQLNRHFC